MNKIDINNGKIYIPLGEGSESKIYLYKDKEGKFVALKKFKEKIDLGKDKNPKIVTYKELLNKMKKLEILSKLDCMKNEVKPIDLIFENDKFVGYTMKAEDYNNFENYLYKNKKIKIELLKNLRDKLEILNKEGIYIGDFNTSNFGVSKDGSIKLFDIDNFYVQGLDFNITTPFIDEYKSKCTKIDNIDNYCFNFFTLAYTMDYMNKTIKSKVINKGLPRIFNTEEGREILNDMLNINDNYQKRYFLDYTKKGLY